MNPKRTGKGIASYARFMKQTHKVVVIVEGGNDIQVFKEFFNKDEVIVISSDGKENAIEAIQILNSKDVNPILCIVDSDFDNIEKKRYCIDSLFFTDDHDLDLMIANSSALDKYLAKSDSQGKIKKIQSSSSKTIFAAICDCLEPLSCCRLASIRYKLYIKFSDLKFSKFLDHHTLKANIEKLIDSLQPTLKPSVRKQLKEHIKKISSEKNDRCQLCNGHDFYQALAVAMRKYLGDLPFIQPIIIEKDVRLAYDANAFAQTKLYADLKTWGAKNNVSLFNH